MPLELASGDSYPVSREPSQFHMLKVSSSLQSSCTCMNMVRVTQLMGALWKLWNIVTAVLTKVKQLHDFSHPPLVVAVLSTSPAEAGNSACLSLVIARDMEYEQLSLHNLEQRRAHPSILLAMTHTQHASSICGIASSLSSSNLAIGNSKGARASTTYHKHTTVNSC